MRITTRGKIVAATTAGLAAFAAGLLTGHIAWDGSGYSNWTEQVELRTDG